MKIFDQKQTHIYDDTAFMDIYVNQYSNYYGEKTYTLCGLVGALDAATLTTIYLGTYFKEANAKAALTAYFTARENNAATFRVPADTSHRDYGPETLRDPDTGKLP